MRTQTFNLLVFGGSQGARFFAEFMPKVMAELPQAVLKNLHLTQQCRPEDMEAVKAAYERARTSMLNCSHSSWTCHSGLHTHIW